MSCAAFLIKFQHANVSWKAQTSVQHNGIHCEHTHTCTHTLPHPSLGPRVGHWSQLAPEERHTVWWQMLRVCLCVCWTLASSCPTSSLPFLHWRHLSFFFVFFFSHLVPKKYFLLNPLVVVAPAFRPHWGSVVTLQHTAAAARPSHSKMSSFQFNMLIFLVPHVSFFFLV